MKVWDIYMTR